VKEIRKTLALKTGKIIPILGSNRTWREFVHERCLSVDTTASGGNAALLANSAE
jgi:RHH-type proline utilization regulon transcriptional repressor/proline dehydrogenase/delta 1-pyrroline-5-carboxylate dehydrogenase